MIRQTSLIWDITLTNANTDNGDYFDGVDGDITIEDGERAVVSFADDAGELIVEFGDDAWFEFNARGQGKLNLAYNTKFNRDFAYDYDHANIDFINFVAEPTTNKTGTLYIYADEDSYIYEVTSKGAKKINGAYYDDDEGAWVIRTRHLTSYAISDRRLKTIDQMEDDKTRRARPSRAAARAAVRVMETTSPSRIPVADRKAISSLRVSLRETSRFR